MQLLTALNYVMPYLGENTVTNTDARHPTVALVLSAITNHRIILLSQGWWFNERETYLYPDSEGHIATPDNLLAIYPLESSDNIEDRNGQLYDLNNGTFTFTLPVHVRIIEDLAFEDLPTYAAMVLQERAAIQVFSADYGVESVIKILSANEKLASDMLMQENLRKKRYNSMKNSRAVRMTRALRG